MKKYVSAIVALLSLAVIAMAQQSAAQNPAQGVAGGPPRSIPAPNIPPMLPKGKVAVVNTALFPQQLGEYRVRLEALNKQFEPRVKEVQGLADRITALENTIKTQSNTLSAAKVAEMTEQLESMKRDYQRKSEDLQADGNRAESGVFEPLQEKMRKFTEEYTAKRGIVLLIDRANAQQAGTLLWFDQRTDVTQDFINEYNKANPVPTAAAPAKP